MEIPSHQIYNVLKVYTKNLSQNKLMDKNITAIDKINISAEGKRKTIINKITNDIVDRITKSNHNKNNSLIYDKTGKRDNIKQQDKTSFIFNVIDNDNNKITNTISVEDSKFVIKRFEKLTQRL